MGNSALSFTAAIWPARFLMCGIFHVCTGIPLSDFYPFGASENDFTVGPTLDGSNSTMLDQEFPFFDETYDLIYTNTYQCVLVSDGIHSFTFFHYADGMIEWTTGDETGSNGLGGREAEIGYDAGDGVNYQSIYLSGTPEVINITSTSNVGIGGVWAFRLDQEEEPVVPDQEEEPTVPDEEEEESTIPDQEEESTIPDREEEESTIPDQVEETMIPVQRDEPTVSDQEEEPTKPHREEPSTISDQEESTIPDQVEETMVPDYNEGPVARDNSHGTISRAFISIIVASIVVVVLISISTLALGAYCIRKWKKRKFGGSLDNSAHVYEEVEGNIEMKVYKRKDMPVYETYEEFGNVDINMNECVAYATIKT